MMEKINNFLNMKLEQFLNTIQRKVVSIPLNIKKSSFPQLYGVSAKVNYLMIVKKI